MRRPTQIEIEADLRVVKDASVPLLGGLAGAVSFLILFAWLSEEVFEGTLQQFDFRTRTSVHAFSNPQLTTVMQALTFLGSIGFLSTLFIMLTIVFLVAGLHRSAVWLAVAAGGSVVLDVSLKLAFHRPRPVPFFGTAPLTYSFPSGHALSSLCFYGVLAGLCVTQMHNRAARIMIWVLSGLLVAGIGLSRIYLGVHYTTDVIAGYLAASIWVSALLVAVGMHRRSAGKRS